MGREQMKQKEEQSLCDNGVFLCFQS